MALSAKDAQAVKKAAIQGLGNTAAGKAAGEKAVSAGGGVAKAPVKEATPGKYEDLAGKTFATREEALASNKGMPMSPAPQTGISTTQNAPSPTMPAPAQAPIAPKPGQFGSPVTGYFDNYQDAINAAHKSLQAKGQAPADAGAAMGAIQEVKPQTEDTTIVDSFVAEDSDWQSIQQAALDFLSPITQKDTLLKEYDRLYENSGIEKLDQEIIDAESIIDGTEDDIRNEVQMAGGFATDSQVQAMALSRNKSLLKRYNQLVATRESAQKRLDTMLQLSAKDREMAQQRIGMQLDTMFKMAEFKQKARNNIQEQYRWLTQTMGADGVYNAYKNDPRQLGFLERSLGIAPGGLQSLAQQAAKDRALDTRYKNAQIDNIYSTISDRADSANSAGTISGKPQNATQAAANSYANRLNESNVLLSNLGGKFTGAASFGSFLPNFLQSGDRQAYEVAKKNFVTAVLRRESGASIAPSEFDTASEVYFPQRGDTPETVALKEQARNTVINNFYREADVNRPVLPGQIIESEGVKYRVGVDGITLEKI